MTDIQGEPDPQMDQAEQADTREPHWPDEEETEPALPRTEEGIVPPVVGGTTPTGQIPVAAAAVRPPEEPSGAPEEGGETGDPDEWRVPRD